MSSEVAARYAKALFNLSLESNRVEEHLGQLEHLALLLKKHARFLDWLASPHGTKAKRKILAGLSPPNDSIYKNFLLILLDKFRISYLPEIIASYKKMASHHLGVLNVRLISTIPINDETKERLIKKISEKYHQKTRLSEEIDPSLIAGSIIMIGNKMIDFTLKGKLARLKKHLLRGSNDH